MFKSEHGKSDSFTKKTFINMVSGSLGCLFCQETSVDRLEIYFCFKKSLNNSSLNYIGLLLKGSYRGLYSHFFEILGISEIEN